MTIEINTEELGCFTNSAKVLLNEVGACLDEHFSTAGQKMQLELLLLRAITAARLSGYNNGFAEGMLVGREADYVAGVEYGFDEVRS